MNKRVYKNKWDIDLMVCIGTDIPPLSTVEFLIYGRILELIDKNCTNTLSMDDIFDGYTHTKRGRFELISRLVKRSLIKRNKADGKNHIYTIIPKMRYQDSKEMRIYNPKTRRENLNLKREFSVV